MAAIPQAAAAAEGHAAVVVRVEELMKRKNFSISRVAEEFRPDVGRSSFINWFNGGRL